MCRWLRALDQSVYTVHTVYRPTLSRMTLALAGRTTRDSPSVYAMYLYDIDTRRS